MSATPDERRRHRLLGLLVLLAMALHLYVKWRLGTLPEMLWACNVASVCIALGLLFEIHLAVATGFLWHVCLGEPAYIYGAFAAGHTGWSSILVHSLPAILAAIYLKRRGLPRLAPLLSWLMFLALVPLSARMTPQALNINLAFRRLPPLEALFPATWAYRLGTSALYLLVLLAGDFLLARWLRRPAARAALPEGRPVAS